MISPIRHLTPVLLALLVAACHGEAPTPPTLVDNDYRLKHPIVVEPTTATLRLQSDESGLVADGDRRRLHDFAGLFIRKGSGPVEISVGAHGADDGVAREFAQAIAQSLLGEGLKVGELKLQLVIADLSVRPLSAALKFSSTTVNLPPCDDWSEGTRNGLAPNFGCAVQRNIGAMVADPRDLDQPRDGQATHSARDDAIIDKLNRGEATWSVPLPLAATSKSGGGSSGGQ